MSPGDRIFTVGHSSLSTESFSELLVDAAVIRLADVRRYPSSRRHPQFNGPTIASALDQRGIAYRHFEALGGFRQVREDSPHRAWEEPFFRAYADHLDTESARRTVAELVTWCAPGATAIMCAEQSPLNCHRRILSDALLILGFVVIHILGKGETAEHRLTPFARVEQDRLIYDGGMLPLG